MLINFQVIWRKHSTTALAKPEKCLCHDTASRDFLASAGRSGNPLCMMKRNERHQASSSTQIYGSPPLQKG